MAYVKFPINNHLDRLKYDEFRERSSLFGDNWAAAMFGSAAAALVPLYNMGQKKHWMTGIWRMGITIPIGVTIGYWYRDWLHERSRKKWAMIRHYIELHPEDFPDYPPRITVGETLAPWIPRRPGW